MALSAAFDRQSSPTRGGMIAAGQWVGVEVGITLIIVALILIPLSISFSSGTGFTITIAARLVTFLALAMLFRRKVNRANLSWPALGYHWPTRSVVVVGLTAGILLLLGILVLTQPLDSFLFPHGAEIEAEFLRMIGEGGIPAAILLLPFNGLLGPIVEEYAWRGYIQNRLSEGIGLRYGVAITAVLFAAKHIVADVSLFRTTTLLVLAFALGLIRIRWSTTASSIAHIVMNSIATTLVIAQAFGCVPE